MKPAPPTDTPPDDPLRADTPPAGAPPSKDAPSNGAPSKGAPSRGPSRPWIAGIAGLTGVLGVLAVGWSFLRGEAPPATAGQVSAAETSESPASRAAVPWHELEQRRDLTGTLEALEKYLSTADRIAGARALARIGGPAAAERLQELLRDEALQVVRWAAFGVGQNCAPAGPRVQALSTRAATLYALAQPGETRRETLRALAEALGRCGTDAAEDVLRGWLGQPGELPEHALEGLAQLAARHGHLAERTQVALLAAASQGAAPLALFPFTRLTQLSAAVQTRLIEVAGEALTGEPGPQRSFAVRALGQAGPAAVAPLSRIVPNDAFGPGERAMAAQALGRMGAPGQQALAAVVETLPFPSFDALKPLRSSQPTTLPTTLPDDARRALEAFTVWSAVLGALEAPGSGRARLRDLAALPLPTPELPVARRRAIALRCAAADLVAGPHPGEPLLHGCDPDDSGVGALALLRALDRGPLREQRLATWRKLVEDPRPAVRQAALRLLGGHPEVPETPILLRQAIESDQLGTVVTALQLVTAYPARAATAAESDSKGGDGAIDPALAQAVEHTLRREDWQHALEARASALDAVGALGLLNLKGLVEEHCRGPHPELREHAARALGLLGDPKRRCADVAAHAQLAPPAATSVAFARSVRLELTTDIGPLTLALDGAAAPAAVERLTRLAEAGYYDGLAVHRVVEGFVVQFGDAPGDGFGEPDQPPLPCERSPLTFEPFDVGMAIAGRDTATTQWFVALDRYPQLDGVYTRIGRAEGPWDLLAAGDRVHRVRLAQK